MFGYHHGIGRNTLKRGHFGIAETKLLHGQTAHLCRDECGVTKFQLVLKRATIPSQISWSLVALFPRCLPQFLDDSVAAFYVVKEALNFAIIAMNTVQFSVIRLTGDLGGMRIAELIRTLT